MLSINKKFFLRFLIAAAITFSVNALIHYNQAFLRSYGVGIILSFAFVILLSLITGCMLGILLNLLVSDNKNKIKDAILIIVYIAALVVFRMIVPRLDANIFLLSLSIIIGIALFWNLRYMFDLCVFYFKDFFNKSK